MIIATLIILAFIFIIGDILNSRLDEIIDLLRENKDEES